MPRPIKPRPTMPEMTKPVTPEEAAALLAPLAGRSVGATGLLLAVSGGPDSMALLHLAARWRDLAPQDTPPLFVATVDHGLRTGSDAEAEAVGRWCRDLSLPHQVLPWTGDKPTTGLHEAARAARYALLCAHAATLGASHLATAHHADDQAETVLMRLTRGSGMAGLAGMAPSRRLGPVWHVRPFLGLPKARLVATLHAMGHPFFEDPSNADPRFGRARLRRVMPLLEPEGLTADRLATLARRAARAEAALDHAASLAFAGWAETGPDGVRLRPGWLAEPEEIALRLLLRALEAGPTLRLERAERLLESMRVAAGAGKCVRRSLAGRIVALDGQGGAHINAESPRRRGRRAG